MASQVDVFVLRREESKHHGVLNPQVQAVLIRVTFILLKLQSMRRKLGVRVRRRLRSGFPRRMEPALSELVSVVHVRIVVFGDHHSVGELAAGQSLHGFLTVGGGNVLHKDLQGGRRRPGRVGIRTGD